MSQNNSFFLKAKLQIIPCSQKFFFVHSHISSHFLRKMKKNVKMADLVKLLDYHRHCNKVIVYASSFTAIIHTVLNAVSGIAHDG